MSLFELNELNENAHFPTEPAFLVPVEVRDAPQYGTGQKGVYATEPIAAGTKFWVWTDRVERIHYTQLKVYIAQQVGNDDLKNIQRFLQQGFVLPNDENHFCSNPTDAGRFMNHSSDPNCGPDGTLRHVAKDEELTMDYSFHGDPQWYRDICYSYGVKTEAEIALQH
jgi:hypothetical protein